MSCKLRTRRRWTGALAALAAAASAGLPAAAAGLPPAANATGEAGACSTGSAPTKAFDEEELSLLQTDLHVNLALAALEPSILEPAANLVLPHSHGRKHCHSFAAALRLTLVLAVPFSLLVVLISWTLCVWTKLGQALVADESERASQESKPKDADAKDREMPRVLYLFCGVGNVMLSVNFTIMLPTSEVSMVSAGGNMFLSGLAIGAYAVGSIVSVPFVIHFSRHSYRTGIIFMSVVAVLGNAAYSAAALSNGLGGILGMILARMLCGLEGGSIILFANAAIRLCSGAAMSRAFALLASTSGLGLACGPALSSLSQMVFPGNHPEIPPSVMMVVLAGIYGVLGAIWVPTNEVCFEQAGLPGGHRSVQDFDNPPAYSEAQLRAAWLSLCVQCTVNVCRVFQRVAWEAGALVILVKHYGVSQREAGFLVVVPVLGSLGLLFFSDRLHRLGTVTATRCLSVLDLLGIFLMFRIEVTGVRPLLVFMLGSCFFYSANWVSTVPYAPLRARFALPGHRILNVESATSFIWIAGFIGYFYGPVLSRAVLGICASQNILASFCLVTWAGSFLALEAGVGVLLEQPAKSK